MSSVSKMAMPISAALSGSLTFGFTGEPQPAREKVVLAPAIVGGEFRRYWREVNGCGPGEGEQPVARAGLMTGDVVLEYGG